LCYRGKFFNLNLSMIPNFQPFIFLNKFLLFILITHVPSYKGFRRCLREVGLICVL